MLSSRRRTAWSIGQLWAYAADEGDRQRTAIDVPPARRGLLLSGGVVLRRGVCRRERLFHVFQRQCQLLGIEPFGAAPEAMPLQLLMIAVNRASSSA